MKLQYSDRELVDGLKKNQRWAYESLYDNYSALLYGIIFRILKDEEKASDILQEVFLKVWKKVDDFQLEKSSLKTWLVRIARNAGIDQYRKENGKIMVDVTEHTGISSTFQHPENELINRDLVKTLNSLKPERRILVDMVYLQGYTQQEVADHLAIPLGTVKSRIRTALNDLKTIFQS